MRLVDADELKVSLKGLLHNTWQYAGVCHVIDEEPTVDVVQVVCCKDCVHAEIDDEDESGYCLCSDTGAGMKLDGFCSDGEIKEVEK